MTDMTNDEAAEALANEFAVPPVQEADASPADAVEADGGTEQPEPSETAPEATDKPAKDKSAAGRIAELTWKVREAERRAAELEARLTQPSPVQPSDGEPDPSQYEAGEYDPKYLKDVAAYAGKQAVRQFTEEQAQRQAVQSVEEQWTKQQQAALAKHDDFLEVVIDGATRGEWQCSPAMADAIKTSEVGAEVAYHLAKNPAEAARIAGLTPIAQAREIGRLEARLASPEPSKPIPKTVSDAPTPPPSVRGQGGKFTVAPDTDDFLAFDKTFTGRR